MTMQTPTTRPDARGFTLAELVVVIGIIALLMSLLLPVMNAVMRQGDAAKIRATLSSISTALEQYRSDFGDYPRFSPDDPNFPNPLNSAPDRGARLLARAIVGPAPANDPRMDHNLATGGPWVTTQDYVDACKVAFQDGHGDPGNPFGHKEHRQLVQRAGESGAYYAGKTYSPYIDPERIQLRKIGDMVRSVPPPISENDSLVAANPEFRYGLDTVILDPSNGQPILYYPALAKQPDIRVQLARPAAYPALGAVSNPGPPGAFPAPPQNVPQSFPAQTDPVGLFIDGYRLDQPQLSLFNGFDNVGYVTDNDDANDGRRWQGLTMDDPHPGYNTTRFFLRELLGDLNQNGIIDAGEKAASTGPYLLISGGIDGFGLVQQGPDPTVLPPPGGSPYYWFVTTPIANFDTSHTE